MMKYKVLISQSAHKEIKKIQPKDSKRIYLVLTKLAENPFIGKKLDGKLKEQYSVRVWPYRILYEIESKKVTVLILRVKHRKDIYK